MEYNVWFCSCGRIHVMPNDYIDWLSEDYTNRSIIQVCQNCGVTRKTYLTNYGDGYVYCGDSPENIEIFGDSNVRVLLKKGIQVPMENMYYADYRNGSNWFSEGKRGKVDTKRLIKEVEDDFGEESKDILNSISEYVSGIDWKGTPYDYFK